MALQVYRGLNADRLTFTPAEGEPIYTTDTKKFYIGDGVTLGGVLVTGAPNGDGPDIMIDSEWILRATIETGTLQTFTAISDQHLTEYDPSGATRINNGSTNPDINTTINDAGLDDFVEYEVTGAFYPLTAWLVRRNLTTTDILVVHEGNVIDTTSVPSIDSDDDLLHVREVGTGLNFYREGQYERYRDIFSYHMSGGEKTTFAVKAYSYDSETRRDEIISAAHADIVQAISYSILSIDSEEEERKKAIGYLTGRVNEIAAFRPDSDYEPPLDSEWVLSVSNPEVDSEWVLSNLTTRPIEGYAVNGSYATTGTVDTWVHRLPRGTSWQISGGFEGNIQSILSQLNVNGTIQYEDPLGSNNWQNAQGILTQLNATNETLTVFLLMNGYCRVKEVISNVKETDPLAASRFAMGSYFYQSRYYFPKVATYAEGNVIFHEAAERATADGEFNFESKRYASDSEKVDYLNNSIYTLRKMIHQNDADLQGIIDATVDSVIDSDLVHSKIKDSITYDPILLTEGTTSYLATLTGTADGDLPNAYKIQYDSVNDTWDTGGVRHGICLFTKNSETNRLVYVANYQVLDVLYDDGYDTAGSLNSVTVSGVNYVGTGFFTNNIAQLVVDGVTWGYTNMMDFDVIIPPNTYRYDYSVERGLNSWIDQTTENIKFLMDKEEEAQGSQTGATAFCSVTINDGTNHSSITTANNAIPETIEFDNIQSASQISDFNTATGEYTFPADGVYNIQVAAHQGNTTIISELRLRITDAGVTRVTPEKAFHSANAGQFLSFSHTAYMTQGEVLVLRFVGSIRDDVEMIITQIS